jgi:hypothetical protein
LHPRRDGQRIGRRTATVSTPIISGDRFFSVTVYQFPYFS